MTVWMLPDFDKPRRCPGWSGQGWVWRKKHDNGCENGFIPKDYDNRFRYWTETPTCPVCGVRTLPLWLMWLDWRTWRYGVGQRMIWQAIRFARWKHRWAKQERESAGTNDG